MTSIQIRVQKYNYLTECPKHQLIFLTVELDFNRHGYIGYV